MVWCVVCPSPSPFIWFSSLSEKVILKRSQRPLCFSCSNAYKSALCLDDRSASKPARHEIYGTNEYILVGPEGLSMLLSQVYPNSTLDVLKTKLCLEITARLYLIKVLNLNW